MSAVQTHLMRSATIHCGDVRDGLALIPDNSVQCVVTSPPFYGLRDYQAAGQIGLEPTPGEYVRTLVEIMQDVRRCLRPDGTVWLNLGDTYSTSRVCGPPPKNLLGIPWRVAFALQDDGWILRQDIIWAKRNPMPSSATDRCVSAHEYVFLLAKEPRYYFDHVAIQEQAVYGAAGNAARRTPAERGTPASRKSNLAGSVPWTGSQRNRRSVWPISAQPCKEAHFAVFPEALVRPCIMAGTSEAGCCAACGSPRRRKTTKDRVPTRPGRDTKIQKADATGAIVPGHRSATVIGNRDPRRHITVTTTVGWEHSCNCAAETVPCVVLDPFLGSGTTAAVAVQLGRQAIGCELNPDYVALAKRRIGPARLW